MQTVLLYYSLMPNTWVDEMSMPLPQPYWRGTEVYLLLGDPSSDSTRVTHISGVRRWWNSPDFKGHGFTSGLNISANLKMEFTLAVCMEHSSCLEFGGAANLCTYFVFIVESPWHSLVPRPYPGRLVKSHHAASDDLTGGCFGGFSQWSTQKLHRRGML